MDFLIYNEKIVEKEAINLTELLYKKTFGLKQKIWYGYGGIPLLNENIALIEKQTDTLKLPLPKIFENKRELFRITKRMLNKNKFYRSGYIELHLFWQNDRVDLLITSLAFSNFEFPFPDDGILLTSSNQKKHSQNKLNQFSFYNESIWKSAIQEVTDSVYANSVITNEKYAVCECPFSNIFFIKGDELITPALKTGCYNDILRQVILKLTKSIGLKSVESDSIQLSDLPKMDEIFLASEQNGMQWVMGFKKKRFLHQHSEFIHEKLNDFLKEKSTT